jgi:hypothetical protein
MFFNCLQKIQSPHETSELYSTFSGTSIVPLHRSSQSPCWYSLWHGIESTKRVFLTIYVLFYTKFDKIGWFVSIETAVPIFITKWENRQIGINSLLIGLRRKRRNEQSFTLTLCGATIDCTLEIAPFIPRLWSNAQTAFSSAFLGSRAGLKQVVLFTIFKLVRAGKYGHLEWDFTESGIIHNFWNEFHGTSINSTTQMLMSRDYNYASLLCSWRRQAHILFPDISVCVPVFLWYCTQKFQWR